jgi:NADPH-dependent curcumin reductase CurA
MATNAVPKTMKGVWIEKTGGTEVLQYRTDIPVPEVKEGEVLVKNEYIGINYIDTYVKIAPQTSLSSSIFFQDYIDSPHRTPQFTSSRFYLR